MKIRSFEILEQFTVKVVGIKDVRYYLIEDDDSAISVINSSLEDAVEEYMEKIGY